MRRLLCQQRDLLHRAGSGRRNYHRQRDIVPDHQQRRGNHCTEYSRCNWHRPAEHFYYDCYGIRRVSIAYIVNECFCKCCLSLFVR